MIIFLEIKVLQKIFLKILALFFLKYRIYFLNLEEGKKVNQA